MSDTVIRVENLCKEYLIRRPQGSSGDGLRHALQDAVAAPLRKLRSALRASSSSPLSPAPAQPAAARSAEQSFYALRDVSFEVKRGEVLGIIGRNGAGKSTLLKILSRITEPTSGRIGLKGRVASLLEVGTGFHPELTGRENIFLNGAILGMTRAEVKRKFDEIVDFSGVETFLDTPVKRYSSGMYVRLAFAVAAHLEPEILIIDEVLAVGDAEFQKRCLGKMQNFSRELGRTVLFVSHNLDAIATLCSRCLFLKGGLLTSADSPREAIKSYLGTHLPALQQWHGEQGNDKATLYETWVTARGESGLMDTGAPLEIGLRIKVHLPVEGLIIGYMLYSEYGHELLYTLHDDAVVSSSSVTPAGEYTICFSIPRNSLAAGSYRVVFDVGLHMVGRIADSPYGDLEFTLDNLTGIGRRYLVGSVRGRKSLLRPEWPVKVKTGSGAESRANGGLRSAI